MSVEIDTFDEADAEEWDHIVRRADNGTVFHEYEMLRAMERHSSSSLHALVGYKGQEAVGVLPVYEIRKGGVGTAFSPPPRLGIPYLGPLHICDQPLKQRKLERRKRRFVEGCLEWIDAEIGSRYYHLVTVVDYDDPRPFTWNEYDVTPYHTYTIDIDRPESDLLDSFSRDLRSSIRSDEGRCRIEDRGEAGIEFIHEQVNSRYEAQDRTYTVPLEFLLECYRTLPDGSVRAYVGEVDDEWVSGILVFEDDSTVYYSEGGGKPDVDFPINEFLHWHIIQRARANDVETYDLCGANTPRICGYKSKFNPDLRTNYEIEDGTLLLRAASSLYRRIR